MTTKQKYQIAAGVGLVAIVWFLTKPKKTAVVDDSNKPADDKKPPVQNKPTTNPATGEKIVYAKEAARLRAKPSILSSVLTKFKLDTPLTVIGSTTKIDGNWYNVTEPTGKTGWVRFDVVNGVDSSALLQESQETALHYFEQTFGNGDY